MARRNLILDFLFIILGLPLFALSAIPLLPLGLLLYLHHKWRANKLAKLSFCEHASSGSNRRIKDLLPIFSELIPKDAKSCLDIGSDRTQDNFYLKEFFNRYLTLDIYNADITQDLNIDKKIKLKDNSVDIIILSNILEHLVDPLPIILEANRIAKKYLIIGLPNEYTFDKRFSFLFSLNEDKIYPWGHKHRFSLKLCENLVKIFWGGYLIRTYKFNLPGENLLPDFIKRVLLKIKPSFFAGEVFYLVKKRDTGRKEIFTEENLVRLYPEYYMKEIFNSKRTYGRK